MSEITLSEQELQRITGGYKRPGDQLQELQRQGFNRARIGRVTGRVILERAHYDAVCAGRDNVTAPGPQVRPPQLRAVHG